jgi:hypothetical protein
MLRWFRARASRIAATLIVSLTALGGSLLAPHPIDCHDECAAAVTHDASAHGMRANVPATEEHPLHCLVCHWARSFRPQTETRFVPAPAAQAGTRVHVVVFTVAPSDQVAQPPLRSPPASPALS